nr:sulfatase [uncultured Tolumonas sp.]
MVGKRLKLSLIALSCAQILNTTAAIASESNQTTTDGHKNIIYILVDDQRYDAMGFMNPLIKTPNMDAIAKNGVHYKNAFVTTSLSSPSRASILTGLYAHNHHISDNNPNSVVNNLKFFPEELKKAGYQTGFFGKWHFGGADKTAKAGFAGFDHWVGLLGQGDYWPIDMMGNPSNLNVDGKLVPQKGYITTELTNYAVEWLDGIDKTKPFFMYLGHKGVHADFEASPKYKGSMKNVHFPVPKSEANTDKNYQGKPLWVKNQRNSWHGIDFPYNKNLDIQTFQRDYYETLRSVDDSVGEIRQYLKDHNLDKNTVVMLMGDNGFMFGEHGLIDKRNAYEESMRVPLIAEGPGFSKGKEVTDVVANIDIAPTILDIAGIKRPDWYDGQSFYGLDQGKGKENRKDFFAYEYFWEYDFPYTPTIFALRTSDWKYIQPYGLWDKEELYNLKDDPKEMHNLIDSSDPTVVAKKIELRKQLYKELKNKDGDNVIPYNERNHRGQVFRRADAPPMADIPSEWKRGYSPADKYHDLFPDSVNKKEFVEKVTKAMQSRDNAVTEFIKAHPEAK